MTWTNQGQSTLASSGSLLLGAQGASITSASSITVTDVIHEVSGSATISTISGGTANGVYILVPATGATWSLTTGGNINRTFGPVTAGVPVILVYDGSTFRVAGSGSDTAKLAKAGDTSTGAQLVNIGGAANFVESLVASVGDAPLAAGYAVGTVASPSTSQQPVVSVQKVEGGFTSTASTFGIVGEVVKRGSSTALNDSYAVYGLVKNTDAKAQNLHGIRGTVYSTPITGATGDNRTSYGGWLQALCYGPGTRAVGAQIDATNQMTCSVTAATNASPIAITTDVPHGLSTGDKVTVSGVLGNTGANGDFTVTVTSSTAFTMNSSAGTGAYTSGGTVYPWSPASDATLSSTIGIAISACGTAPSSVGLTFQNGTGAAATKVRKGIYFNGGRSTSNAALDSVAEYAIDLADLSATPVPIRIGNAVYIVARNAANSADVNLLKLDGNNVIVFGNATSVGSSAGLTLANGANNNIAIGTTANYFRISGPTGAFSITGLANGVDGRVLRLHNTTNFAMTIANSSASSSPGNIIKTLTGADITLRAGNSFATLIYSASDSMWIVTATN